jgi:hypothetical protein
MRALTQGPEWKLLYLELWDELAFLFFSLGNPNNYLISSLKVCKVTHCSGTEKIKKIQILEWYEEYMLSG